jgi:REP element-mobilizing transposase RayT
MKLIEGVPAAEGDPEFSISRGRLMPQHRLLDHNDASTALRQKLQDSLVLVHGGMAQNVGPILEMVTEKYLLRSEAEWQARSSMLGILQEILGALGREDVPAIGDATTRNFYGPIQTIIPWATNLFTETLIHRVRGDFGRDFLGFWMLGGMSGGGMGFIFNPARRAEAQSRLQEIMSAAKRELQHALPFAMEPVVYDFTLNERGTFADLLASEAVLMPAGYYALITPPLLKQDRNTLPPSRRAELDKFGAACRTRPELRGMVQTLFDAMLPRGKAESTGGKSLEMLLREYGFDRAQHEQIRADLKDGRIGLAQNRLPASAIIEDVKPEDVVDATAWSTGGASFQLVTVPTRFQLGASAQSQTPTQRVGGTDTSQRLAPLPFIPFDQSRPASIRWRYLPHWRQEGATYFVTFRLADSLPASFVAETLHERDEFIRLQGKSLSPERRHELLAFYREKIETELDAGHGNCVLRNAAVAHIVESALRHFDGKRHWLGCFAVMPNHVHAIVRPIQGHELSEILHSWKSFTAREVNKLTRSSGQLWQHESFDHIVRDEHELERISAYVAENPMRANLPSGSAVVGHGSSVESEGDATPESRSGAEAGSGASLRLATVAPSLQPGAASQTPTRRVDGTDASRRLAPLGLDALKRGEVGVVTLAAGAGSRWTQGAGVVKALHPFCRLGGQHRTFLETHLAKSRRVSRQTGSWLPHLFTTSYLSHEPIREFLARQKNYGYEGEVLLSPGRFIGLRLVPTVRDLRFAWEELPQQLLDEQAQKVRESLHAALINWARNAGEVSDYTDNLPLQCLHPVGHWYEIPNLLCNGVLARLLTERPQLKYLMLHNIDTLGAGVDPALLGRHIESGACLTFEVISRRIEDRGGGLARVNGRVRLVEGLAMPREELEFALSYYNSNTCWFDLEKLLAAFGLTREEILATGQRSDDRIATAIRKLAVRMPTYITLKDVKKRWGHGQEDVFPVCQFEKLWVDMSSLPEIDTRFVVVPRLRGQQLKDQAQLDGWLRDGSAAYVESLCEWE